MNTNELKRFAREARIKLLDQVGRKLEYVITADTAELRGMSNQINDLRTQINKIGKDQVIEKVAYTWFNRLMALRFMDANGYNTPMVVTPIAGYLMPQVLQEAKAGNVEENLQLDRKRLNDLLDGKTQVADAQTEAYKLLLIASCNALNSVMPFMFERISDYTELLLPDDLLSDYSIITDVRNGMTEEDCKQEELIGWLYQFYIADKKDEVFSELKKNVKITAENIPAATQLFTPRWIVRYMVENTLGKLWLTLKPKSKLKEHMPYYIEAPEGNEPTPLPQGVKGVTDIKFLDPCQGSGHVLVYAFDLFTKIYEEEGYNTNEIPGLILENNLFGIDIDERAAQLAAFALTMKGRSYYARFLRKPVKPNVIALENIDLETIEQTIKLPIAVGEKIKNEHDELTLFHLTQAKNFGSLIQIDPEELKILTIEKGSIWEGQQEKLQTEANYLSNKYHCVVTNPPYMGGKGMNEDLKSFVEKFYKKSKTDLMACFIERTLSFSFSYGLVAIINQHTWMFLTSYEDLRKRLVNNFKIESLLHLGPRTFPEIGGEVVQNVAFVLLNCKPIQNSVFIRLIDFENAQLKESKTLEAIQNHSCGWYFIKNQLDLNKIKGAPVGYWISEELTKVFGNPTLNEISPPRAGLTTGDNEKFIRYNFEIEINKLNVKWFRHTKGGGFHKWYGKNDYLVNWANDGEDIKNQSNSVIRNPSYYFNSGFSWSDVGSNLPSFRYQTNEYLPNARGPMIYSTDLTMLAYLNSKIAVEILKILNPTIVFNVGDIANIPLIEIEDENDKLIISKWVTELIEIYKKDENRIETSLGFKSFSLLNSGLIEKSLKDTLSNYFEDLLRAIELEEKINTFFIQKYKLELQLNPKLTIDELTLQNEILKKTIFFSQDKPDIEIIYNKTELIIQLVSYTVGCMFGRFSFEKPGLIIANLEDEFESFQTKVPNCSYLPDKDNIIPILEGEYFKDDIVGEFCEIIKNTFDNDCFTKNIEFIETIISKEIRKYFIKDFYNDHIKRYKKRPIYWMFSSPKGHFKALIYMHRYRPDTISTMLNDYLRVYIGKLESEQQSLNQTSISESASARERTLATKRIAEIEVMLKDLKIYERTLFDYAAKKIEIDLDDGVKVNYLKFKEILLPIKGLDKDEE